MAEKQKRNQLLAEGSYVQARKQESKEGLDSLSHDNQLSQKLMHSLREMSVHSESGHNPATSQQAQPL
jgi:hypothetical protein